MRRTMFAALALFGTVLVVACSTPGANTPADQDSLVDDSRGEPDFVVPDTHKPDTKQDTTPPVDVPDFDTNDTQIPDVVDVTQPDILTDNYEAQDQKQEVEEDTVLPAGKTVKEVQESQASVVCEVPFGAMLVDVGVTIETAYVTAPAFPYQVVGNLAGFYVQDAGGGPNSGMLAVFALDQLPDLKPGASVQLFGNHKESQCETTFVVTSLTVKDFQGAEPEPYLTTTAEIVAAPESFEGVFVKLENVQVLDPNPDSLNGYDYGQFLISDGMRVGNDYKVPYMTPPNDARKAGDTFNFVVGIVKQSHGNWVIMPRSHMDMWLSGTSFPEEEPEIVVGPEPDVVELEPDVIEDTYVPPDIQDTFEAVEEVVVPDVVEVTPDVVLPDVSDEVVVPPNPDTTLVITEIMVDPVGVPDAKGEWIEIYNTTAEPININGWRFTGVDGNSIWFMGTLWIPPGDYYVFGANKTAGENGGTPVDYDYPEVDWDLNDTADTVTLRNMMGQVVDSMAYDKNAGWPLVSGATMQLIHPNLENLSSTFWRVSEVPYGSGMNKGSPGTGYNNP